MNLEQVIEEIKGKIEGSRGLRDLAREDRDTKSAFGHSMQISAYHECLELLEQLKTTTT